MKLSSELAGVTSVAFSQSFILAELLVYSGKDWSCYHSNIYLLVPKFCCFCSFAEKISSAFEGLLLRKFYLDVMSVSFSK